MSGQKRLSEEDLRRIIGLAEVYANEQNDLSEDQVREIGETLGIPREAMDRAIARYRSDSATGESKTAWLQAGPGSYLVRGGRPGFSGPLLARLMLLGGVGVAVAAGMLSAVSSIPLTAWALAVVLVCLFIAYPASKLVGQALTRSFVVGLANRVVVGKQLPSGQVIAWERPLTAVELEVVAISNDEGGWEFLPMHEMIFRDGEGGRICVFAGLPKHDLEMIRDRFMLWRQAESERPQVGGIPC